MAFGVTCLTRALTHFSRHDEPWARQLIEELWVFISSSDLSCWEQNVLAHLMKTEPESNQKRAQTATAAALHHWYATLPPALVDLIDEVVEIGRGNLYAGVVGCSPETLESTMSVVRFMHQQQLPLPDLAPFERSSFSEYHGWGNRVDRSFFVEN